MMGARRPVPTIKAIKDGYCGAAASVASQLGPAGRRGFSFSPAHRLMVDNKSRKGQTEKAEPQIRRRAWLGRLSSHQSQSVARLQSGQIALSASTCSTASSTCRSLPLPDLLPVRQTFRHVGSSPVGPQVGVAASGSDCGPTIGPFGNESRDRGHFIRQLVGACVSRCVGALPREDSKGHTLRLIERRASPSCAVAALASSLT